MRHLTRRAALRALGCAVAASAAAGCTGRSEFARDHRDGATVRAYAPVEPPAAAPVTEAAAVDGGDLLSDVLDVVVADDPEAPPGYERQPHVRFEVSETTRHGRAVTAVRVEAERFTPGAEAAVEALAGLPAHDAEEEVYSGVYVDEGDETIQIRYDVSYRTP